MDDALSETLLRWERHEAVGLATVIDTRGSAPRPTGSSMVVGPDGAATGSVSGGCVEGAVYELLGRVIVDGEPGLERYGFSDDDAFAVGLTCGGELDIFVQRIDRASFPDLDVLAADIEEGRPVAVATIVAHPDAGMRGRRLLVRPGAPMDRSGSLGHRRLDDAVHVDASGLLAAGENGVLRYGPEGERLGTEAVVFVQSHAPRPRMIIFGAIDFASAVCRQGAYLGYDVTVCDARPVFATQKRFPDAVRVVVDWPHRYLSAERDAGRIDERTVVVVLTHDAKFDVPVLEVALRLPLAYVGAMGSRRTHHDRLRRLEDVGLEAAEIERLHSPIGLDLGARTPEETAVSILAEVIASRWGGTGTGEPLSRLAGEIHRPSARSGQRNAACPVMA